MSDLTPSYEPETGQVFLESLPAGAAGEARVVPVPGLDLAFDRADGQLCRAVVDAGGAGGPGTAGAGMAAMLVRLFGPDAPSAVHGAAVRPGESRALSPEPVLGAALSRLARLDAARATSPVPPGSPWWAAEAAELAEHAGMPARARAEGRRAVRALAKTPAWPALPAEAVRTALVVAGLAAADEPAAARQLREGIAGTGAEPFGQGIAERQQGPGLDVAAEVECLEKDQEPRPGPQWMLDPDLVPEGLFRPGLSPHSDLSVRLADGEGRVWVEVLLAPGAERDALSSCVARLVDPSGRRVLGCASFTEAASRVWAELLLPLPLSALREVWIEVAGDKGRPVRSAKGHRIRRALRWADAALRAERGPAGLAPRSAGEDWAALAAIAWDRCRRDWESAGDTDRAFLAAWRSAAFAAGTYIPATPSATVAELAGRVPLQEPSYLAEVLGW